MLDRQQHGLPVPCSLCQCPMVNPMGLEMRLAIIQLLQIIKSRKGFRSFFFLGFKALGPAPFSSRYGLLICCFLWGHVFSHSFSSNCNNLMEPKMCTYSEKINLCKSHDISICYRNHLIIAWLTLKNFCHPSV